jgi:hypothetical protein
VKRDTGCINKDIYTKIAFASYKPILRADPLSTGYQVGSEHFLIYFIALLVFRLLEVKLADKGTHVSIDHLIDAPKT